VTDEPATLSHWLSTNSVECKPLTADEFYRGMEAIWEQGLARSIRDDFIIPRNADEGIALIKAGFKVLCHPTVYRQIIERLDSE